MGPRGGWMVVLIAAAAMVGSLPGRTQGLGLVTEPLLVDLGIDRVTYAALNFWATIIGSVGAVGIGYVIDRAGSRSVLSFVLVALGAVVCFMSLAASVPVLAIWITLTRALGQSALSVVSLTVVGRFFDRGIEKAMAAYSVAISVGFMAAFPLVGTAVQAWGWRRGWLAVGLTIAGVLAPLAFLGLGAGSLGVRSRFFRSTPRDSRGELKDRDLTPDAGYTWTETMAMPSFWVFAVGTALYGLVASGIGLFNESILAQRGFGPGVYYQTLAVTALTALAGNFLGGWISDRVPLGRLMAASQFILAGGVVALPFVSTLPQVFAWAAAMGLGGGIVMVLFFGVWGRVFGRRHLGRIQGIAQALTVLASAVGPLLLAWCLEWTGSYTAMFEILAGVIATVAIAALAISLPAAPPILNGMPRAGDATG